jgi:membrane protease YdiL (CAAX protease family)
MLQTSNHKKIYLIVLAWTVVLLVSDLPDILLHEFSLPIPGWLSWVKVVVLAVSLGACVVWKTVRPLLPFLFVFLVFYLALQASTWIGDNSWWQNLFGRKDSSFTVGYLEVFIRDAGVALAVIGSLFVVKRRRREFFLVKGQLDAPIEPVRWLGIRDGESWQTFGWIFALAASLAVLIPTILTERVSTATLVRAIPLLPSVFLFAAINAFTEEVYFRLSLLSTLNEVIGKTQTLLMSAVFFGLAHYLYGSPPGLIGFLMTGFLAWLIGKSVLETRGLFWAWFIHFCPDVVIFASYALSWVNR